MASLFRKRKRDRAPPVSESLKLEAKDANQGMTDSANPRCSEKSMQTTTSIKNEKTGGNDSLKTTVKSPQTELPPNCTFSDLGLSADLVATCSKLGLKRPTPVQRIMIPYLLGKNNWNTNRNSNSEHVLCLAPTGSGKTAAFALPIIQHWQADPFGIYAVVVTPTRELAQQIHQQILALGKIAYHITSALVVGGLDRLRQSQALDARPHFCVATPGRLAALIRGPQPPALHNLRYLVIDEADRLLVASDDANNANSNNCGYTEDMQTILAAAGNRNTCQKLLFSATMTQSLESVCELAGAGHGSLPLKQFIIEDDDNTIAHTTTSGEIGDGDKNMKATPKKKKCSIPAGLKQEYIFMPSRVRDTYLVAAIKELMVNGGKAQGQEQQQQQQQQQPGTTDEPTAAHCHSAILFVPTCERAALISGLLTELGIANVALHSYLSQGRRLASLAKFKSHHVRVLVATDVASRGLDIPAVDLVLQSQLPRQASTYVHRVGRTARAGRRGRAIALVGESEVALVRAVESLSGRALEKCPDVTDDAAVKLLAPVTKAMRLAKLKLQDVGFDELVQKFKSRKRRAKRAGVVGGQSQS